MPKLTLLCVCVAAVALSGCAKAWAEVSPPLGIITVTDGGTASNRSMCASDAGGTTDVRTSGCASAFLPFVIPTSTKITIQCDQAAYVATGLAGVDAGSGMKLAVDEKFPTSTGATRYICTAASNGDGGSAAVGVCYSGGWVSIAPLVGSSLAVCRVFARLGTE